MIKEQFATKTEAAQLLGVNPATIWRWIRSGKLSAEKVGNVVLIDRDKLTAVSKGPPGKQRLW